MNSRYGIGDTVFDNWIIKKVIGEGAYGIVYEIERTEFNSVYKDALKVISVPQSRSDIDIALSEGMDSKSVTEYFYSFVEEIVAEVDLMARLKATSNVVSYEDHRVIPHEDGIGWDILIRMELLDSLMFYTKEHKLTEDDIIQMGIDICSALELCQKHSIIHRDIKPENIFISENGNYKLGDFGIARTAEKTMSNMSKKGTYTYMAPEIYKCQAYGASVDIYSLGIVLYKYLNNFRTPFLPPYPTPIKPNDAEDALVKRVNGEAVPEPENGSGQLKKIVMRACAYDVADRYLNPSEMKRELLALKRDAFTAPLAVFPEEENTTTDGTISIHPLSRSKATSGGKREAAVVQDVSQEFFPPAPPLPVQTQENAQNSVITADRKTDAEDRIENTFPKETKKRKARVIKITVGATVLIAVAVIVLLFGFKKPASEKWSEWTSSPPSEINVNEYIIESKLQYRSRPKEVKVTTEQNSLGNEWILGSTEDVYGDYGEWSDWSSTEVTANDTTEVESKTQYRYCNVTAVKITSGTNYYYSGWSAFSDTPIAASYSRKVQTRVLYHSRSRELSHKYNYYKVGEWGEYGDRVLYPSDTLDVSTIRLYRYILKSDISQEDASATNIKSGASISNFVFNEAGYTGVYSDVDPDAWYGINKEKSVAIASQLGAINGYSDCTFLPDTEIQIADAIKISAVVNNIYNGGNGIFIEGSPWYKTYVDYAIENGIIKSSDFSDVTAVATRAEMAYILANALPADELQEIKPSFDVSDVTSDAKYYDSIKRLYCAGVIGGNSEGLFRPEANATRAEAAAFAARLAFPDRRLKS